MQRRASFARARQTECNVAAVVERLNLAILLRHDDLQIFCADRREFFSTRS
ncbi:MAG: hypothetical protein Q4B13_00275 [Lautropia sp.]|nr:hypothetical protein [Lautropia sp.]